MVRISELNPLCDPLSFPLLFPNGGFGWSIDSTFTEGDHITHRQYYCFHLNFRAPTPTDFSLLHSSGQLFQLYITMAYLKVEKSNLDFLRRNQRVLKSENYNVLERALRNHGDANVRIGTQIILPSTFIGSPRNMHQLYLDNMAIVHKFGPPDLFITFTCNPDWPEIRDHLGTNQTPNLRPDLSSRVFKMKADAFIKEITSGRVFGEVIAFSYVIEFQKRGLPHMHLLIRLCPSASIRNRDDVDRHVSAEIPPFDLAPNLHDLVLRFNIHGPCTPGRCLDNGVCTKKFPKELTDETIYADRSYPLYRRRNYVSVNRHGRTLTNELVVPYSPYLTSKYQGHINVEVCSSLASVKYLYKYMYKGFDATSLEFSTAPNGASGQATLNVDEIRAYQEARYLTGPEACWRLLEFPLHDSSHSIVRLSVHLENEDVVIFDADRPPTLENLSQSRNSTLLAFFSLCRDDAHARTLKYTDIPYDYRWDKPTRSWVRRIDERKVISRMYNVNPTEIERFALRKLLLEIPGPTSFQFLKTGPYGHQYNSYRESAIAWGLLNNDNEWHQCLAEAATWKFPASLRWLFATICSLHQPPNANELWISFKDQMTEDLCRRYSPEAAEQLALREIACFFDSLTNSSSFAQLGLPYDPELAREYLEASNDTISRRQAKRFARVRLRKLRNNELQLAAYNEIMSAVMNPESPTRLFYIDGPGGSGKTFLYNTLIYSLIAKRKKVLAVSWTGISASLLPYGKTSHITFGLPLLITETTTLRHSDRTRIWREIRDADVIVWDEITLVSKHALRSVNAFIQRVMDDNRQFGNKIIVTGGDWRQCLPVLKHGHRAAIVENTVKAGDIWGHMKTLTLRSNMRAGRGQEDFSQWLLSIGDGTIGDTVDVDDEMHTCTEENLIEELFHEYIHGGDTAEISTRAILCPKNEDTIQLNEKVLNLIQEHPIRNYKSVDYLEDPTHSDNVLFPVELLQSLNPNGFPLHDLKLKIGCVVMLIRNLNVKEKLTNGTRCIVIGLQDSTIVVKRIHEGKILPEPIFIPRIKFTSSEVDVGVQFNRHQFPLRLAYAITVNKSQGQTLSRVGLYMKSDIFTHGQLYVALSRVRQKRHIYICQFPQERQTLTNVVYREIFHT